MQHLKYKKDQASHHIQYFLYKS